MQDLDKKDEEVKRPTFVETVDDEEDDSEIDDEDEDLEDDEDEDSPA